MTDAKLGLAREHPEPPVVRDEEPDNRLVFVLPLLWRWRLPIAAATLSGGLAAFAMTWPKPTIYEASAVLMVNHPMAPPSSLPLTPPASIVQLLKNRSLASSVITDLGLDQPPRKVTPGAFVSGLLVVEEIRSTDLIRVRMRLDDGDLAVRTANLLVERAVEFNRAINQREAVLATEALEDQLFEARARLQELEKRLPRALVGQRSRLIGLTVEIEAERARVVRAQEELAKHEKTVSLTSGLLNLQVYSQVLNPVRQSLEQQIAFSLTTLAALERQRSQLVGVLGLKGAASADLRLLYERDVELSKLELDHDLAKRTYTELATRHDQARIAVTTGSAELQVFDPAVGPASRVGPRLGLNVAIGLAAGFTVAVVVVVLIAALLLPADLNNRRRW